jgi:hypothetical protein
MAQGYGPMQPASMGEAFEDTGSYAMQDPMGGGYGGYQDPSACNSCNSCNSCNDDFCCGPKGCGISVGGSAYIISPYFSQNQAFANTTGIGTTNIVSNTTNFNWDYTASPAIWAGYRTAGGLKVRGRFFYFDQFSNQATTSVAAGAGATTAVTAPLGLPVSLTTIFNTSVAGTVNTFVANSKLFINNIDLEAGVYEAAAGRYSFQVYAGARYLYLAENYSLRNTTPVNAALSYFHNFTGGGPTLFAQGARQIGCSNWSIYGNARGALLVGQARQQATLATTAGVLAAPVTTTITANSFTNSTLPTMEIEGGVEYRIAHGRKLIFLRAGAVDMTFFNVGSASDLTSNLSLFGGRASIGCNY